MSGTSPPPEAQRFGRSQTPESPRPVHIPEPANIPVLLNQMDPVFNDTATYNIPHNQTFSPFPDPSQEQEGVQTSGVDDQDAVQNFLREAENQATVAEPEPEPNVTSTQTASHDMSNLATENNPFPPPSTVAGSTANHQDLNSNAYTLNSNGTAVSETAAVEAAAQDPKDVILHAQEPNSMLIDKAVDGQIHQNGHPETSATNGSEGGIDYQSLLDTISQSASTAPAAESLTAPINAPLVPEDSSRPLPSVPGLPPKPPPQERPVEFPSYSSFENASEKFVPGNTPDVQNLSALQNGAVAQQENPSHQSTTQDPLAQSYPPPPSYAGFSQLPVPNTAPLPAIHSQSAPGQDSSRSSDPIERPWSPRTQSLYDNFLEDERRYVTEGIWDKFPLGSRLFVGNLPSEKVTKRDLFHKFHKHGQLAQISIKQAYGFVQFLEAASCLAALNAEQSVEIRGRKVHLEISKPQKNTRNAAASGGNKGQARRRSRSPERGSRRESRSHNDFRDEHGRRRDEFRRRSPSPQSYRHRDDYRASSGRDGRSRSPFYGSNYNAPQIPVLDDEALLQIPRRDPQSVPDVQLLVLEPEVVQSFINWVEQGFRGKGLQASTIWVNNRFPLPAVVKRQVIEGVQAVVKLTRAAQNNSKIPLQVFDRSAGASNVKFSEYIDLDVSVAADIVVQARQLERGASSAQSFRAQAFPPQGYQSQASYSAPQPSTTYLPQQHSVPQYPPSQQYTYSPPQQAGYRPPSQAPTPSAAPPNLQQLLANLRQPSGHNISPGTGSTGQGNPTANLSGFLGNLSNQAQYGQAQPVGYGQYGTGPPAQGTQQTNVQNLMEQLARYQR